MFCILVETLKLDLFNILNFEFSWDADVWLKFWSWCMVEILKKKFDQDLCLNLWYDPLGYFGRMNSTLGSVVPLAMFICSLTSLPLDFWYMKVEKPNSKGGKYKIQTFVDDFDIKLSVFRMTRPVTFIGRRSVWSHSGEFAQSKTMIISKYLKP